MMIGWNIVVLFEQHPNDQCESVIGQQLLSGTSEP
jgi:hypothetical protein